MEDYFALSNSFVQKFVLKTIFESRIQTVFENNQSINSDELEIFFCGSGSPLSFMPEGAQCIAFIIGLDIYVNSPDPLKDTWENFVLPHVNKEDLDHYKTLWNTIVRKGPSIKPKL